MVATRPVPSAAEVEANLDSYLERAVAQLGDFAVSVFFGTPVLGFGPPSFAGDQRHAFVVFD